MRVFHYEVIHKTTGKTIKNFGHFNDEAGFWKTMDEEYPKSKYVVKMTKPKVVFRESKNMKESEDTDMSLERAIVKKLSEASSNFLNEDLRRYKGKPMKSLLKAISGTVRLRIELSRPNHYGSSGYGGTANGVSWCYADLIIKDIEAADGRFNDIIIYA